MIPPETVRRLAWSLEALGRHPDAFGGQAAIDACTEHIEVLYHQGRLTPEQRSRLLDSLRGPLAVVG